MIRCTIKQPAAFGAVGAEILMHPMDALEYHNLGVVEADPKFLDDLKKLDAAKRKEK